MNNKCESQAKSTGASCPVTAEPNKPGRIWEKLVQKVTFYNINNGHMDFNVDGKTQKTENGN